MQGRQLVTALDRGVRLVGALQRLVGEHIDDGVEPRQALLFDLLRHVVGPRGRLRRVA